MVNICMNGQFSHELSSQPYISGYIFSLLTKQKTTFSRRLVTWVPDATVEAAKVSRESASGSTFTTPWSNGEIPTCWPKRWMKA